MIAVTRPWKSLLVIMLIFCIISYYYAIIVFYNFYLDYEDFCKDFYSCFFFIVDRTFKDDGGYISYLTSYDEFYSGNWPENGL